MDSRSSRPVRGIALPVLVSVLVIGAVLIFADPAAAQTSTTSSSYNGITPLSNGRTAVPTTTGGTTTGSTTTGGTTTDGTMSDFEQMLLTELQQVLTKRFPDADPMEVNFLADLLLGFFMEQIFYNQLQQMNGSSTQR